MCNTPNLSQSLPGVLRPQELRHRRTLAVTAAPFPEIHPFHPPGDYRKLRRFSLPNTPVLRVYGRPFPRRCSSTVVDARAGGAADAPPPIRPQRHPARSVRAGEMRRDETPLCGRSVAGALGHDVERRQALFAKAAGGALMYCCCSFVRSGAVCRFLGVVWGVTRRKTVPGLAACAVFVRRGGSCSNDKIPPFSSDKIPPLCFDASGRPLGGRGERVPSLYAADRRRCRRGGRGRRALCRSAHPARA